MFKVVDASLKQQNILFHMIFFWRKIWLYSFSVFVIGAIKQFTRSDGIIQLLSNKC